MNDILWESETTAVSALLGKTFESVSRSDDFENDAIVFTERGTGKRYVLTHEQDCCESVTIEDINGELSDLVGEPLTMAEESTSGTPPKDEYDDSRTWTFYRFATNKGFVNIRFYGTSSGWYSESVDMYILDGLQEKSSRPLDNEQ